MRLLITGAGGQLGREMQRLCRVKGLEFLAADSAMLDITSPERVREVVWDFGPDAILNCAAYNAVDLAETEWRRAFLVNGIGVRNLALAAHASGAVLVHYSTDYVFDGRAARPYTIADAPAPINRYGESKLLGETMVRDLCRRYYLIRLSWLFGHGKENFVNKVIQWSSEKTELRIVEDQVASPTYTADLAEATLALLGTGSFGLYHVTNSGSCSRFEWADYILGKLRWEGSISPACSEEFSNQAARPAYSVLDNFGTEEALGHRMPQWRDATDRYLLEIGAIT